MTTCEFRKLGKRYLCTVNGLDCMVDDGDPLNCMRYAWVKQIQSKTAKIAQLSAELQDLAVLGLGLPSVVGKILPKVAKAPRLPLFPELPDGEAVAPHGYVGRDARP